VGAVQYEAKLYANAVTASDEGSRRKGIHSKLVDSRSVRNASSWRYAYAGAREVVGCPILNRQDMNCRDEGHRLNRE